MSSPFPHLSKKSKVSETNWLGLSLRVGMAILKALENKVSEINELLAPHDPARSHPVARD
jgi:hypothetical protein